MMKRIASAGLLLALLSPLAASAADIATPACIGDIYGALAKEQRLYRSVVFGAKDAQYLPINSFLYDKEGKAWLKTETDTWREIRQDSAASSSQGGTQAGGNGGGSRDNGEMDKNKDTPTRRGLLEAKRTGTSDLIPPITQSLRALECRLRAVCEISSASLSAKKDEEKLKVQPEGCIEIELPVLRSCSVTDGVSPSLVDPSLCDKAVKEIFLQESNILSLSIAYDASYRTVAQFAGMFEGFLSDFRFPLINPLWQTVRTLGGLKNIPCFLSQCEE